MNYGFASLRRPRPVETGNALRLPPAIAPEEEDPEVAVTADVPEPPVVQTASERNAVPTLHTGENAVFSGEVMVQDWTVSPKGGRVARFALMQGAQMTTHPFRGMRTGRAAASGQRLRISVLQMTPEEEEVALYVGEASLVFWGEDSTNGMRLTVRFDDGTESDEGAHPLSGVEADRKAGETVFLSAWAVADDETVEEPQHVKRSNVPFRDLPPVKQAQIRCRLDREFQGWCLRCAPELVGPAAAADAIAQGETVERRVADIVRRYLDVPSRSVLSHDTAQGLNARTRWRELLRRFNDAAYAP